MSLPGEENKANTDAPKKPDNGENNKNHHVEGSILMYKGEGCRSALDRSTGKPRRVSWKKEETVEKQLEELFRFDDEKDKKISDEIRQLMADEIEHEQGVNRKLRSELNLLTSLGVTLSNESDRENTKKRDMRNKDIFDDELKELDRLDDDEDKKISDEIRQLMADEIEHENDINRRLRRELNLMTSLGMELSKKPSRPSTKKREKQSDNDESKLSSTSLNSSSTVPKNNNKRELTIKPSSSPQVNEENNNPSVQENNLDATIRRKNSLKSLDDIADSKSYDVLDKNYFKKEVPNNVEKYIGTTEKKEDTVDTKDEASSSLDTCLESYTNLISTHATHMVILDQARKNATNRLQEYSKGILEDFEGNSPPISQGDNSPEPHGTELKMTKQEIQNKINIQPKDIYLPPCDDETKQVGNTSMHERSPSNSGISTDETKPPAPATPLTLPQTITPPSSSTTFEPPLQVKTAQNFQSFGPNRSKHIELLKEAKQNAVRKLKHLPASFSYESGSNSQSQSRSQQARSQNVSANQSSQSSIPSIPKSTENSVGEKENKESCNDNQPDDEETNSSSGMTGNHAIAKQENDEIRDSFQSDMNFKRMHCSIRTIFSQHHERSLQLLKEAEEISSRTILYGQKEVEQLEDDNIYNNESEKGEMMNENGGDATFNEFTSHHVVKSQKSEKDELSQLITDKGKKNDLEDFAYELLFSEDGNESIDDQAKHSARIEKALAFLRMMGEDEMSAATTVLDYTEKDIDADFTDTKKKSLRLKEDLSARITSASSDISSHPFVPPSFSGAAKYMINDEDNNYDCTSDNSTLKKYSSQRSYDSKDALSILRKEIEMEQKALYEDAHRRKSSEYEKFTPGTLSHGTNKSDYDYYPNESDLLYRVRLGKEEYINYDSYSVSTLTTEIHPRKKRTSFSSQKTPVVLEDPLENCMSIENEYEEVSNTQKENDLLKVAEIIEEVEPNEMDQNRDNITIEPNDESEQDQTNVNAKKVGYEKPLSNEISSGLLLNKEQVENDETTSNNKDEIQDEIAEQKPKSDNRICSKLTADVKTSDPILQKIEHRDGNDENVENGAFVARKSDVDDEIPDDNLLQSTSDEFSHLVSETSLQLDIAPVTCERKSNEPEHLGSVENMRVEERNCGFDVYSSQADEVSTSNPKERDNEETLQKGNVKLNSVLSKPLKSQIELSQDISGTKLLKKNDLDITLHGKSLTPPEQEKMQTEVIKVSNDSKIDSLDEVTKYHDGLIISPDLAADIQQKIEVQNVKSADLSNEKINVSMLRSANNEDDVIQNLPTNSPQSHRRGSRSHCSFSTLTEGTEAFRFWREEGNRAYYQNLVSKDIKTPDLHDDMDKSEWTTLHKHLVLLFAKPEMIPEAMKKIKPLDSSTPLHRAVWLAPPALTLLLILLGDSCREVFEILDNDGNTPLHLCAANLQISIANEKPFRKHDDSKVADNTPADEKGIEVINTKILTSLVDASPEVAKKQNAGGDTPLHLLVSSPQASTLFHKSYQGIEEVLSSLVKADKNICKLQNGTGATPLHIAISNRCSDLILNQLIDYCPDCCAIRDKQGMLPLHYVAAFGHISLRSVKKIVDVYPEAIHQTSLNGDTPLHVGLSNALVTMVNDNGKLKRRSLKLFEFLVVRSDQNSELDQKTDPLLICNNEKVRSFY